MQRNWQRSHKVSWKIEVIAFEGILPLAQTRCKEEVSAARCSLPVCRVN